LKSVLTMSRSSYYRRSRW